MTGETFNDTGAEKKQSSIRDLLLDAASRGEGFHTPLMIGDTVVEDYTFEFVRDEFYRLKDEGLVGLSNTYQPYLTEKGIEKLASS
jgi:hypothetical protein